MDMNRSMISGLVFLSILHAMPAAALELPTTPSGRRAEEVIGLLSGTSSLELDDYIEDQYAPGFRDAFPTATHKALFQATQTMFGRVTAAEISVQYSCRAQVGEKGRMVEPDDTGRT